MSSSYGNFKKHVKLGDVPTKRVLGNQVPQSNFYKSVHCINSVIGPVKNVSLGSYKKNSHNLIITFALASVILQPLYLALAYLLYWQAKGLAKVTYSYDLKCNARSLIDYSSMLSNKACNHSDTLATFVNAVLSYAVSTVIWPAALVITPLVWTSDKVASKFSDAKSEGGGPFFQNR
ncbi:hypothetical protein [Wolbachia endosymbiont of Trichogramma pretiosum]